MRPDRLDRASNDFVRMTPGERKVFLDQLRRWHLQRRIEAVASRGFDYPYRGPTQLSELSVSAALGG